jgi:hypothetical protein
MSEPGLDLHEWQTRWQEVQDEVAADPEQAIPEVVHLIEQMLQERGYELGEPVTTEGEDPDIVRTFLAAREIATAAEHDAADPADIQVALDDLAEIHDYLTADRAPP